MSLCQFQFRDRSRLPFQPTWWPVARSILLALFTNTIIVCVRSNLLPLRPLTLQMISWRGRLFQYSFTLRLAFCDLFSFPLLPMEAVLESLSRYAATLGCFSRHFTRCFGCVPVANHNGLMYSIRVLWYGRHQRSGIPNHSPPSGEKLTLNLYFRRFKVYMAVEPPGGHWPPGWGDGGTEGDLFDLNVVVLLWVPPGRVKIPAEFLE